MMTKTIAIIPARGGSKGIPRKNIISLCDKPLISWTIQAALNSNTINDVYVSTEDIEIAEISKSYGAKIIKRPMKLASDLITTDEVIFHAIEYLKKLNIEFSHVCLLQPTSPLRNEDHIDGASLLARDKNFGCIVSVYKPKLSVAKAYILKNNGTLEGLISSDAPYTPRQQLPDTYIPNGAIYFFSKDSFLVKNRIPRERLLPYIMDESVSIDIDNLEDLKAVKNILIREK